MNKRAKVVLIMCLVWVVLLGAWHLVKHKGRGWLESADTGGSYTPPDTFQWLNNPPR